MTNFHLKRSSPVAVAGFGLMEILVSMAVGMIALIVVAQTFAVSEGQRRTTVSGSDAHQTALVTLSLLEANLMNAGLNLTSTYTPYDYKLIADMTAGKMVGEGTPPGAPNFVLGCNARYGTGDVIRMAPVTLLQGASGAAPDELIVVAGGNTSGGGGAPVPANEIIENGATDFELSNGIGFRAGDWIVIAEQNISDPDPKALPETCTIAQIVSISDLAATPNPTVKLDRPALSRYEQGWVFNLGPNPVMAHYWIENRKLMVQDLLGRRPDPMVVAEGVVNLQAQYGFDVSNDDQIDEWLEPTFTPTNPSRAAGALALKDPVVIPAIGTQSVNQVKAVRIGLTLQSGQLEKPDSSGKCVTSPEKLDPLLSAETSPGAGIPSKPSSGDFTLAAADRCYRYSTHATVIPIYNMLWSDL